MKLVDRISSSSKLPVLDLNGNEVGLHRYIDTQTRLGAMAVRDLFSNTLTGKIPDEYPVDLIERACDVGAISGAETWKQMTQNRHVKAVLNDWMNHFALFFGAMTKECRIPIEIATNRTKCFQDLLIGHVHHMQDIWREHAWGKGRHRKRRRRRRQLSPDEELDPARAWKSLEWQEPHYVQEGGGSQMRHLRQDVLIPHVVPQDNGKMPKLVLNSDHMTVEPFMLPLVQYMNRPDKVE